MNQKLILYYSLLLFFLLLLGGFLLTGRAEQMSMPEMLSVSVFLGVYVVLLSVVGEGHRLDERDLHHRAVANRMGLVVGTVLLSVGILYQLFHHTIDYWLLLALAGINLTKILSLIASEYRN